MKEKFSTSPDNSSQETLQEGVGVLESEHPASPESPDETLEKEQEQLVESIDQELDITEGLLEEMKHMIEDVSEEEAVELAEELEKKGFMQKLKDASHKFNRAQADAEKELSKKYNEKIVKRIGLLGKTLGGVAGFAGVGLAAGGGLVGGAVGAIAGARALGQGSLKLFDAIAKRLPESIQKRISSQVESAPQGIPSNEWMHNPEYHIQEIEQLSQENALLQDQIESYIDTIQNLEPKRKEQVLQKIANNPKTVPLFEKIKKTSEHYNHFWHEFEYKYPHVAAGLEMVTHISIPLATKGMLEPELVKAIIIQLETFLAGGGGEKITAVALKEVQSAHDRIKSFIS